MKKATAMKFNFLDEFVNMYVGTWKGTIGTNVLGFAGGVAIGDFFILLKTVLPALGVILPMIVTLYWTYTKQKQKVTQSNQTHILQIVKMLKESDVMPDELSDEEQIQYAKDFIQESKN